MKHSTLTTVPLEIVGTNNTSEGMATGFFYESTNGELFLATNWHVLTGRSSDSPRQTSKARTTPQVLRCKMHERIVGPAGNEGIRLGKLVQHDILINSNDGNEPNWLEHPVWRHQVDVAAVPIQDRDQLTERCLFRILNRDMSLELRYQPDVADDVFVVGYPWGLNSGGALPIYKRGSIASEPQVDFLGRPRFLIDCRTGEAMSGSPVYVRHNGFWTPDKKEITGDSSIGTIENFVGVYSGRRLATNSSSQIETDIGIVWKTAALEAIVNSSTRGTTLNEIGLLP